MENLSKKNQEHLKIIAIEVIKLQEMGEHESIDTIMNAMDSGKMIEHLIIRFGDKANFSHIEFHPENTKQLNDNFKEIRSCISAEELGVTKEENGLLLFLSTIIYMLQDE